jgi:hypothetical protein
VPDREFRAKESIGLAVSIIMLITILVDVIVVLSFQNYVLFPIGTQRASDGKVVEACKERTKLNHNIMLVVRSSTFVTSLFF